MISVTEVSPVWDAVSGSMTITAGMSDKLVKVSLNNNGKAASTTGYSSGVQSWRVALRGESFQNNFFVLYRGLRTIKIGVTNDGVNAANPTIVAWHTLSGSSTSVASAPVLRGSSTNSFCFGECIVQIILDLSSSPNTIKFSLVQSDNRPMVGRPFLIQQLPASQTWYPWVFLERFVTPTFAMIL